MTEEDDREPPPGASRLAAMLAENSRLLADPDFQCHRDEAVPKLWQRTEDEAAWDRHAELMLAELDAELEEEERAAEAEP